MTAVAPVAWGRTYFVTHAFLPAGQPLWGAALRALPAGLLLLAVRRRRPQGAWWWRSAVLGVLNVGAFFTLIYIAAQRLPTSVAATVMALSPVAMMLLAWWLVGDRPRRTPLAGALLGLVGVALLVLTGTAAVDAAGLAASVTAMLMSSLGFVLSQRWTRADPPGRTDVLAMTSWQLTAGGLALLAVAAVAEGAPPALDGTALLAAGYVTVVATAVAFAAWFAGLRRLGAGTVGLVGLLNPVTGVLLGVAVAGEVLAGRQLIGLTLVLAGVLLGQPAAARWFHRAPRVTAVTSSVGTPRPADC